MSTLDDIYFSLDWFATKKFNADENWTVFIRPLSTSLFFSCYSMSQECFYPIQASHWPSNQIYGFETMNQLKFKWRKCSSAIGCSNNWATRLHQPTFPFRPIRCRRWMESLEDGNNNECWKLEDFCSQRIGWNKFRHGFGLAVRMQPSHWLFLTCDATYWSLFCTSNDHFW